MAVTLTYTSANGTSVPLTPSNGYEVLQNPAGLAVAPQALTLNPLAGSDGSVLSRRRHDVRPIMLALDVSHPTRLQTRVNELARMLLAGEGTLTWDDGTVTRQLRRVVYEAGLDGGWDPGQDGARVALSLLALDPWWYGQTQSAAIGIASPTAFDAAIPFDDAIPFDGGAATAVTVDGDEAAFPVFSVVGPFTTLAVSDGTSTWELAAALGSGETLLIDSRPASRGPRTATGGTDWSLLSEASRLWTLPTGTSSIIAGSSGSGAGSSVTVTWETRWLTP